jgi:large subunit ribosomal protein L11
MIKKYKEIFKLTIKAGQASPTPPIGPMLGQRGINMMEFSKEFNNKTKHLKEEAPIPVNIIVNKNRSFQIDIKTPTSVYFFKKLSNINKGSSNTKHSTVSNINIKSIYEIAKILNNNLNENQIKSKCKILIASAKSMGININK